MKILNITEMCDPLRVALKHSALAVAVGAWLAGGAALAAPPANDNFANAIDLTGAGVGQTGNAITGTQTGTNNVDATLEAGELATVTYPPPNPPSTFNNSVWFKWTCPEDGTLTVKTNGSTHTPAPPDPVREWDAVLGVFTGSAVNALTPLGASPQDTAYEESLTVPVIAGVTYRIQLAGFASEVATNILLDWNFVRTIYEAKILTMGPGTATIDEVVDNKAAIELSVLFGTNLATLAPTFTLSPGATCNRTSGAVPTPANFGSGPVTYIVTAAGLSPTVNTYTVTAVVAPPSAECDITSFGANVAGSYTQFVSTGETTGTIIWTVPAGTTVAALAPTYTISAGATCLQPNPGVPSPPFSTATPVPYLVKAQDAINAKTYSVIVKVATPPPVASGLRLWLDASQVTGLADGQQVETWTDKSGLTGNDAVRSAGSPKFKTNVLSGKPVIRFDNASSFTTADLASQFPTAATVFIMTTINSDSAYTLVNTTSGADEWWRYDGNGKSYSALFRSSRVEAYCDMPSSGSHLFAVSSAASAWQMWIDGSNQGVAAGAYGAGGVHVIGNNSNNRFLNGDIAEVIEYDRVLTEEERLSVEAYLMDKWMLVTDAATISAFGPGAVIGPVVDNAAEISWTLPSGTDVTALPATFTMSPGATCNKISGAAQNFTTPVVYKVTSLDTSVTTDYTVTVTVRPPFIAPTPPPVTSGMAVWLTADNVNLNDPSQTRFVGDDTFVKQWNDLSGNSNNAANATESEQPKYIDSALNGKPAIRFTQVNDNSGSRLMLGDLSAQFWATVTDPFPTAVNRGSEGAGINGTYMNLPSRGVAGALVGDSNTATTLNGSTQYVDIPYSANLNPPQGQPWSAEIWAKSNVLGTLPPFSSGTPGNVAGPPGGRQGWVLYFINNDLSFRAYTNNGANATINGGNGLTIPGLITPLTWYHVVVTCDGTDFRIFLNGVQVGTTPTVGPNGTYSAGTTGTALGFRLGAGNYFNGALDEAAFYTTALSQPRIQAHYQNGINNPARSQSYDLELAVDSPVAHYKLDEAAGPVKAATVFAVTTINNDTMYSAFGNRANDERWMGGNWSEVTPGAFRGARANFPGTYAQMPSTGTHIFAYESGPTAYRFLLNGAQIGTTTGDYNAGAGVSWVVGSNAIANGAQLNGDIAELILFNRTLTPLEEAQVGGYLEQKYGLTTAYPPLDLTVTLTSPGDTQMYPSGTAIVGSATVTAGSISGGTEPYTVEFWVDGALKGTSLSTANPYTFGIGALASGPHTAYVKVTDSTSPTRLTATSATHSFTVAPGVGTTTTLVSTANPSTYGAGTLTATVVASDSSELTGGTVQFFDGSNPLGSPVAVDIVTGEASYSINTLGVRTYSITAVYSGHGVYTASSTLALAQEVNKAPLTVTANTLFRPTGTANLNPLPYKITGYQNGQNRSTSGILGDPLLTTAAVLESPAGNYPITCALGTLESTNYSFTLVSASLTVAEVPDTFSVNFFVGPDWPYGGLGDVPNTDAKEALKVDVGMPAGLGDWFTNGWLNYLVPWAPGAPQAAVAVTSNRGSTATFRLDDCRNGWTYTGTARTTLVGDGNGNMMDAHVNGTLDPDNGATNSFKMEMSNIPFAVYDVIFYMGANQAQFGDGKGAIVFNGGAERDFTLQSGAFDGTFTEMVDATTLGNYIVFKGVTGSSFTTQIYGKGEGTGFNHIGPFGFQIRPAAAGYSAWAIANAGGQPANQDFNNDGVQNGIAYFMGVTGIATNPGLDATNKVTWPMSAAFSGTYEVQTSPDLGTWTNVTPRPLPVAGNLSYTLPPGMGKQFLRLLVTPTP